QPRNARFHAWKPCARISNIGLLPRPKKLSRNSGKLKIETRTFGTESPGSEIFSNPEVASNQPPKKKLRKRTQTARGSVFVYRKPLEEVALAPRCRYQGNLRMRIKAAKAVAGGLNWVCISIWACTARASDNPQDESAAASSSTQELAKQKHNPFADQITVP